MFFSPLLVATVLLLSSSSWTTITGGTVISDKTDARPWPSLQLSQAQPEQPAGEPAATATTAVSSTNDGLTATTMTTTTTTRMLRLSSPVARPCFTGPTAFTSQNDLQAAVRQFFSDGDYANLQQYGTNMNQWDVSQITDFSNLFSGRGAFNEDISCWDVSSGISFFFHVRWCQIVQTKHWTMECRQRH
jgi:Mycoplasma protein of unknown function, DUF285